MKCNRLSSSLPGDFSPAADHGGPKQPSGAGSRCRRTHQLHRGLSQIPADPLSGQLGAAPSRHHGGQAARGTNRSVCLTATLPVRSLTSVLFLLPADPEGNQTGPGAGGDLHRLRGRHGRGEVCAILRPVHALAQTHRGERRAEGAAAASRQDHRVHQPDRAGCRQGEGTSSQDAVTEATCSTARSGFISPLCSVTSSCRTPLPSCSCSSKPRRTSTTWKTTILR